MNKTLARIFGQSPAIIERKMPPAEVMEKALITGDLASLTTVERLDYYESLCRTLKLNPLTKPFEYIVLKGKLTIYARKDCTDQLRKIYGVGIQIVGREVVDGIMTVTSRATMPNGRTDEALGAVWLPPGGEDRANAIMKAETKSKRRVTLSICGLGIIDESEIESAESGQMTAEDRVKAATANRTGTPVEAEIIEERIKVDRTPNATNATTFNGDEYLEVVCHIGKAQGPMLGKKVRDIPAPVLSWLQSHFGPSGKAPQWGNESHYPDIRLKSAVDLALKELDKEKVE